MCNVWPIAFCFGRGYGSYEKSAGLWALCVVSSPKVSNDVMAILP